MCEEDFHHDASDFFESFRKKLMIHIGINLKSLRLQQKHLMNFIRTILMTTSGPTEGE